MGIEWNIEGNRCRCSMNCDLCTVYYPNLIISLCVDCLSFKLYSGDTIVSLTNLDKHCKCFSFTRYIRTHSVLIYTDVYQ